MKLPDYKAGAVQSLGRESGQAYGALARAKGNLAFQAVGLAGQIGTDYVMKQRKEEIDAADYALMKDVGAYQESQAGKEYYSARELSGQDLPNVRMTDQVTDDAGKISSVPRDRIPAHEVQAQMFENFLKGKIDAYGSSISHERTRNEWTQDKTFNGEKIHIQNRVNAKKSGIQYVKQQEGLRIQDATDNYNFKMARHVTNNSSLSDPERLKAHSIIDSQEAKWQTATGNDLMDDGRHQEAREVFSQIKDPIARENALDIVAMREETDPIQFNLINENMGALNTQLKTMKMTAKDYNKTGGELTQDQRTTWAAKIQAKQKAVMARAKAGRTASTKLLKDELKTVQAEYVNRNEVDPEYVNDVIQRAIDNELYAEAAELKFTMNVKESGDHFAQQPFGMQAATIALWDKPENLPKNQATIEYRNQLKKNYEADFKLAHSDTATFVQKMGVIDITDLPPMGSGADFAEAGQRRIDQMLIAKEHYGVMTGFLKAGEIETISNQFEQGNAQERLRMIKDLDEAFGEYAPNVFGQLGHNLGSYGIVGEAYARNPRAAETIVRGLDMLSGENPEVTFLDKKLITKPFHDATLGLWINQGPRRGDVETNVLGAYAALMNDGSRSSKDIAFDQQKMDQAIQMVTGGVYEIGGVNIVAPDAETSQTTMEVWLTNVGNNYLGDQQLGYRDISTGAVVPIDSVSVMNSIRSGKADLESRGQNEYYVKFGKGYVLTPNGEPMIFSYDKNADMIHTEVAKALEKEVSAATAGQDITGKYETSTEGQKLIDEGYEPNKATLDQLKAEEDYANMSEEELLEAAGLNAPEKSKAELEDDMRREHFTGGFRPKFEQPPELPPKKTSFLPATPTVKKPDTGKITSGRAPRRAGTSKSEWGGFFN